MENKRLKIKNFERKQSGQAMITFTAVMLFVSLLVFFGISSIAADETRIARRVLVSERALFAAEAGIEDMAYRFLTGKQTPSLTTLVIDNAIATTTVTAVADGQEIISRGEVLSYIRAVKSVLTTTAGVSFQYGAQIGDGGLLMENNSVVNGSVYSNGNITGQNSPRITGDAFAAASSTVDSMTIDGNARAYRFVSNDAPRNTIGGSASSTTLIDDSTIGGNAWADVFDDSTIAGNAFYKTSISADTSVGGQRIQIAEVPSPLAALPMPISDAQLDLWEGEALAGGTATSSCSSSPYKPANGTILGPQKIPCDVSIEGTAIVTLNGTLWVAGNFNMQNSAQLRLAPSFGALSGIVIADKTAVDGVTDRLNSSEVKIQNSAQILGSGQPSSYIMVVSRNNSAESGGSETAIDVGNSSTAAIYYAPHGEMLIQNNVNLKEATSWKMRLKNSGTITYESGLANVQFSSGPTGGWQIQSWTETN